MKYNQYRMISLWLALFLLFGCVHSDLPDHSNSIVESIPASQVQSSVESSSDEPEPPTSFDSAPSLPHLQDQSSAISIPDHPAVAEQPTVIEPLYFNSAEVESLYAVNATGYVMAKIDDYSLQKDLLRKLEQRKKSDAALNGLGYLIWDESGRHYVYLTVAESDEALSESCTALLAKEPLHPSWLIHMTTERVVQFGDVTDKIRLQELSQFLKQQILVKRDGEFFAGQLNPNSAYSTYVFSMKFDSGVMYVFIGTGNRLSIYASDLGQTVSYELCEGVADQIREELKLFLQ